VISVFCFGFWFGLLMKSLIFCFGVGVHRIWPLVLITTKAWVGLLMKSLIFSAVIAAMPRPSTMPHAWTFFLLDQVI